ncbi:MAG: hypothetical protein JXA69_21420 [Phycisphaerae bacterium]|nr:hypothetical protein [Phycisphaerae bacterium]
MMLNFRALQTPSDDGEILIEPAFDLLGDLARQNRARLAEASGALAGAGWAALRRHTRRMLNIPDDAVVIMTGHQPEFIHAGVWAKHVVAQQLAETLDGVAVNLVVDNDVPKAAALAIPGVSADGRINLQHVPFAEWPAGWPYESLPALGREAIERIAGEVARCMGSAYAASMMPTYLAALREAGAPDYVTQAVAGRRAVEASFGVSLQDRRASAVWGGPILADWLRRPRAFAEAYNAALDAYRREQNVRSPNRPIPSLRIQDGRVELPVWAYGPGEPRQRLFVEPAEDEVRIFAEDVLIGRVAMALLADPVAGGTAIQTVCRKALRPRALALTLWARLLACDLFIHGIGGAKYDRITDTIIRSYYGLEPPAMACVSATLRLPLPRTPVSAADRFAAQRRVRDVFFQPDRWAMDVPEAAPLLAERRSAIERSDALRQTNGRNRPARREIFDRIRAVNARLVELRPEIVAEAQQALARLDVRQRNDRIATGRDYFFALLPREKLESLCRRLRAVGNGRAVL